jgi:glutamate 5-kinase
MTFQVSKEDGLFYRQTLFDRAKRVVVKVGSAVLTGRDGLDLLVMDDLARQIAFLADTGREVILVTSGAVAAGKKRLGAGRKLKEELMVKQALAAIGQGALMGSYEEVFAAYGRQVAQLLLTHTDLSQRDRYLNVRNTILSLFDFGVIPIINENDTVSVEELRFGDNDTLGALIANMIDADMYIMLTDVDGLCTGNPAENPESRPVYTVSNINSEVQQMAGHTTSSMGTGGMRSKIRAAKMVATCGGSSFIGPGQRKEILKELFSGDLVGTFFLPDKQALKGKKHWIAYVLRPQGYLVIDQGACSAVQERGKSLLPTGIQEVRGTFGVGAPVHCLSIDEKTICAGLVNYSSEDIIKVHGHSSDEIEAILGFKDSSVVIHRDNLVVLGDV